MQWEQNNEYIISIMGIDELVLKHQGNDCHNAENTPMRFQLFIR